MQVLNDCFNEHHNFFLRYRYNFVQVPIISFKLDKAFDD